MVTAYADLLFTSMRECPPDTKCYSGPASAQEFSGVTAPMRGGHGDPSQTLAKPPFLPGLISLL